MNIFKVFRENQIVDATSRGTLAFTILGIRKRSGRIKALQFREQFKRLGRWAKKEKR